MDDDVDLVAQMSWETGSCYWCGAPAVGTARDEEGGIYFTCGAEGHGVG